MYHYKAKKRKKLAKLTKVGGAFQLTVARFDPSTGEKKDPLIIRLEKDNIKQRKAMAEEEAADLGDILKDMESLALQ